MNKIEQQIITLIESNPYLEDEKPDRPTNARVYFHNGFHRSTWTGSRPNDLDRGYVVLVVCRAYSRAYAADLEPLDLGLAV